VTKATALAWLKRHGTQRNVLGMARYGIVAKKAFGVSMAALASLTKQTGKDHKLAVELWKTGWHEAKALASLIDDPLLVTPRQMDAWASSFENWADCDTACFKLFDQTPYAYDKARQWAASPREFVRRGGFALMASLALHDKKAPDSKFVSFFRLIEKGARDERNFVKKGVSWALRGIGHRSRPLLAKSVALAKKLAAREDAPSRWVGKDVLRDLDRPMVQARAARREHKSK